MSKKRVTSEDLSSHRINRFTMDDRSQAALRAEDYSASLKGKPAIRSIITGSAGGWDKDSLSDYNVCVVSAEAIASLLRYEEMDTEKGLVDEPLPFPICSASQTIDDLVKGELVIKIRLSTPDIVIKRRIEKLLKFYRTVGKIKVVSKKKPPEIPYWEIFDLMLYDKMSISDIVRVHGHRFKTMSSDKPSNLKKRIQRAYEEAVKIIIAHISYMDLFYKLSVSE